MILNNAFDLAFDVVVVRAVGERPLENESGYSRGLLVLALLRETTPNVRISYVLKQNSFQDFSIGPKNVRSALG